jgi:lipid-A-disaccharide synthase
MVNLIAGAAVVPELVQDDFSAENVVCEVQKLLQEGPDRLTMLSGLARVRASLEGPVGAVPAPERAAAIIRRMLPSGGN